MTSNPKLLLIGCGKMGSALLQGWLSQGIAASAITVVEPNPDMAAGLAAKFGVTAANTAEDLGADFAPDVVILAVKPQVMDPVLQSFTHLVQDREGPVFLSIAAGRTIASFEARLGRQAAIVRAMPNTPAAVGRGITVGCANTVVSLVQRDLCDRLMSAVGTVEWVDDEGHMDAVTAVSGSGPAYVFLLAEAMAKAGRTAGLPPQLSEKLAHATVAGAGELLYHSTEPAATLRENVTSPGGTTAAALAVLMDPHGLDPLVAKAIMAATRRSRELAQ